MTICRCWGLGLGDTPVYNIVNSEGEKKSLLLVRVSLKTFSGYLSLFELLQQRTTDWVAYKQQTFCSSEFWR